jgi:hypothetical protein
MSAEKSQHSSLKQKTVYELKEITYVFLFLAFFFCALSTYRMLLLKNFEISFIYGTALLNAFLVTKVILIGEAAHLGRKHESWPLIYSCVYKSFLYGLLIFAFHIVEEIVKRLIHGQDIVGAFQDIRLDDLLARSIVIFCTFIPFFAFRELGRVLGPEKLRALFFESRAPAKL